LGQQIIATSKVADKLSRWEKTAAKALDATDHRAFIEKAPEGKRKRIKNREKTSDSDHIKIAHRILIEHHYLADVAKEFRLSIPRISSIVKKISDNIMGLRAVQVKSANANNKDAIIRSHLLTMMEQRRFIDSCEMARNYINERTDLGVNYAAVRRIMKDQLHMSFRRVEKGPLHLNSVRNRVLRQQGALRVLELLRQNKVIITVDETWVNETDFRRRKWRPYGSTNAVPTATMTPRVTMIAALDSLGNVYLCITQANSNNKTMEIYFHHLVARLNRERPGW